MSAPTALDSQPAEKESLPLAPGRRLGDFLITRVVGQGGFGIVYEAEDLTLQRRVAIKEYMPSQLAARIDEAHVHPVSSRYAKTFELGRRSFLAEARLLAQFRHPGLLEVLHFWEQNGTAYMVMPFYEGRTLDQVLSNGPARVTESWLKSVIRPVLDALEHMHASDCYHRDVSADNILIRDDGKALLLDLGAARRVIGDSERALTVMLKPGYAPIEQYADDPACRQGPWTDIYALAAVLHFAVTMRMPPASASRVMHDSLPALGTLKPAGYGQRFLEAIDRGLSIRPEQRPRTIGEFRSLLFAASTDDVLATAATSSEPHDEASGEPRDDDAQAPPVRGRAPIAVIAVGLLGAVALSWFAYSSTSDPSVAERSPGASTPAQPAPERPAPAAGPAREQPATDVAAPSQAPEAANPRSAAVPTGYQGVLTRADAPKAAGAAARPASAAADVAGKAAVARTGVVRLSIAPWGEVFVDGVSRGVTPPLKRLELVAGRYRIEIRNSAAPNWTREVVVRAGEQLVVSHRFQ